MANEKVASVILKYIVDSAAAQRAAKSAESVIDSMKDTQREALGLGPAAQAGVSRVQRSMRDLRGDVTRGKETVEDLRRELLELDNVRVEPEVRVKRTGGGLDAGDVAGKFGTASSALGGLSALGSAGAAYGEIGQVGDIIESTTAIISSLGPSGVIAAGGLVLVGAALTEIQRQAEITSAKAKENFQAVAEGADIVRDGLAIAMAENKKGEGPVQ